MRSKTSAADDKEATLPPVRIVVVDDHVFMRELISTTLSRQSARYLVLASVGTGAAAIAACEEFRPDLLILDINLPDKNGIEAVPEIKRVSPRTHVLLCTAHPTEDRIVDSLRVGARGFVEKTNSWDDFLVAVDRVARGDQYFSSKSSGVLPLKIASAPESSNPTARSLLSPREQEVLRLIAQGCTSKEIAGKLFISVATVETHRTNLMTKLGVRNVASLVLYAFQNGLTENAVNAAPSL
jgi:DNA-binding NarL/FixJ family response regulator